jgi:hypothetical protein
LHGTARGQARPQRQAASASKAGLEAQPAPLPPLRTRPASPLPDPHPPLLAPQAAQPSPPLPLPPPTNRFCTDASKAADAKAAAGSSQGELKAGCLALFAKNDKLLLGLVMEADGKKNWFMLDQVRRRASAPPKAGPLRGTHPRAGRLAAR